MSDSPDLYVLSVGQKPPAELQVSALGVGFTGSPDSLFLVFHEEFLGHERSAIAAGEYRLGMKLYRSSDVCGLAWSLSGAGFGMLGYCDYSLALVRRRLGEETLGQFRDAAKSSSLAGDPGKGLLLRIVFVDPADGLVFALRVFTLPRLFSDRLLAGILATENQDEDAAANVVRELCDNGLGAWRGSTPGVACPGHDLELSDGEWARLIRRDREKRSGRR